MLLKRNYLFLIFWFLFFTHVWAQDTSSVSQDTLGFPKSISKCDIEVKYDYGDFFYEESYKKAECALVYKEGSKAVVAELRIKKTKSWIVMRFEGNLVAKITTEQVIYIIEKDGRIKRESKKK